MEIEPDLASNANLLISGRTKFAWTWFLPSTPIELVNMHARLNRYMAEY